MCVWSRMLLLNFYFTILGNCHEGIQAPVSAHIWGAFQKTPLSSRIEKLLKYMSFNVWARYFVWNFKGYLWNSTQNILPIHWKIQFVHNVEILRACRFKSSYMLLKHPEDMMCSKQALWISNYIPQDTMGTIIYPCSRYVLAMHKSIYVDMWEVTRPWGHGHIRMMVKLCNVLGFVTTLYVSQFQVRASPASRTLKF